MINSCWYYFKFGIVVALVVVLGMGAYFYTRMDDEIRLHVEQLLAGHFSQLNVSVGGARLVKDRGIAVYDLSISETATSGRQNNLILVDELMILCDVQIAKLVHGDPKIHRIVAKHPQLWVTRETDHSWNIESLWPLPKCGNSRPQVDIQDAQVTISDQSQPDVHPLQLRDVNLSILREESAPEPSTQLSEASSTSDYYGPPVTIQGTMSGTHLEHSEIQARVDPDKQQFSASATIHQWELSRDLHPWLRLLNESLDGKITIQGLINGTLEVEYSRAAGFRYTTNIELTSGQMAHPRLPRPLTDLSCQLQCDNHGLQLDGLRAKCGPAAVSMALKRIGWTPSAPLALSLSVKKLPIDEPLHSALPPYLQAQWQKYLPNGEVDVEATATFDGRQWQPQATLSGRKLSFESDLFRYRLVDGTGVMKISPRQNGHPTRLDIDITGIGGGQPVRIVGQVLDPKPGAAGEIVLTGRDLEIEQRMIAALPEKARRVISSMHPEGRFHFQWRASRIQPGLTRPKTSLHLELVDCRFLYEKFPYPLRGVHGLITAEDKDWTFHELLSGGTRMVRCRGSLKPARGGQPADPETELNLQFTGEQIPLDEDLRHAVPESVQKAWAELRPRGQVDFIANVKHQSGFAKPNISVKLQPHPENASIEPRFFPYLIHDLDGSLTYNEGDLQLDEIRGRHGPTRIHTNGDGYFDRQGGWQVRLVGLSADKVSASRDLKMAMPLKLRKLIDQLNPTGTFSLHDTVLGFSKAASSLAPIHSTWDLQLDCHQSDLQLGVDLTNVFGSVRLRGGDDGQHARSAGELAIDSATFQDVQFTDISGPLWVDETNCWLGQGASQMQKQSPRRIKAKVYNGQIVADAGITFGGIPKYAVVGSLTTADLSRIMNERFGGQREFRGTVSANFNLQGKGRSEHNLLGRGEVQVRDANIYELPLLVGLLKMLRSRSPDTTAFNQSNMKFRLEGRHIYLDQIDFLGDAVSLYGKGATNFDQQLEMDFYGVIGRNDYHLPLVKKVVARTNENIMQMYVTGTLSNPKIHTQALPGINKLLQRIQSDLNAPPAITELRQVQRGNPNHVGERQRQ